ncbi:MAG: 5-bromo-4-chloroindolyl phosphate hydrolysis family protein [Pseudomonadota bacterium]
MPEVYKKPPGPALSTSGLMLYLLALPLLPAIGIALVRGSFPHALSLGAAFALLLAGARCVRKGLAAEKDFERRKIAKPPALPLKSIGAVLVGVATAVTSYFAAHNSPAFAALVGVLATAGSYLAYGADPRRAKLADTGEFGPSTEQVIAQLATAERKIEAIEAANRAIANSELSRRLRNITRLARRIVATIEEDPRDIRRARKFLNVYLDGARSVTEGYAKTHKKSTSEELEANFRNVLATIEDVFTEQQAKLLENNELDLDVQIEVLATQLKREGVV